jgi:hypothetical protein
MRIFARHKKSTISLMVYALWWIHLFYWFTSGASANPNSCGAANGGLIMLTLLMVVLGTLILLVFALTSKGERRVDYLIFLVLVLIPVIYVLVK